MKKKPIKDAIKSLIDSAVEILKDFLDEKIGKEEKEEKESE